MKRFRYRLSEIKEGESVDIPFGKERCCGTILRVVRNYNRTFYLDHYYRPLRATVGSRVVKVERPIVDESQRVLISMIPRMRQLAGKLCPCNSWLTLTKLGTYPVGLSKTIR